MSGVNEKFQLLSEKFANAIKELAEAKRDVDECITAQPEENTQKLCCHESEDRQAELDKLRFDNAKLIEKQNNDKVIMIKACNNLDELQRRYDQVLRNSLTHKTENQSLKNTIAQLQLQLKERADEYVTVPNTVKNLQSSNNELKNKYDNLVDQFQSFKNEHSEMGQKVNELEDQVKVAEDRCLCLEVGQNALTVKHEEALAAKEAQITELQDRLENLKTKFENDQRVHLQKATEVYKNICKINTNDNTVFGNVL